MRLAQCFLSAICFTFVAAAICSAAGWGFWMQGALSMALIFGVSLSVDVAIWAHEARKHRKDTKP